MSDQPLTSDEVEAALRAIGAERYHNRHPFHRLLHGGRLTRGQVQAWALNRFYYQRSIPIKDATLMARLPTAELRRMWRARLVDHDGDGTTPGGIERWLKLAEGVGLDRGYVDSTVGILPTTRFSVVAYVKAEAKTREQQDAVLAALRFKCDVLWAQLDGLYLAYVAPGFIPPGAFVPA